MLALYHRLAHRCQTRNQLNKVHIALENRMTPNELLELWRHYHRTKHANPLSLAAAKLLQKTKRALFAGNTWASIGSGAAPGSQEMGAREWTDKLQQKLLLAGNRSAADFARERLAHSAGRYSNGSPRHDKTLLFCFSGNAHRMMMPMPLFLQHLDPNEVDVVYLRTEKHAGYRTGIRGIGNCLPSSINHLMERCQVQDYARIAIAGTSGGGMPALLAALQMGAAAVIAVGANSPDDPRWEEYRQGGNGADLFRHFIRDPETLPAIHLVHGADHPRDGIANQCIADYITVSSITSVENSGHAALFPLVERGQFHALLRSTILPVPVTQQTRKHN